jgi:site-specific recombinase XerD
MPQLFVTDMGALRRPLIIDGRDVPIVADVLDSAVRCGLTDGMPFILGDDGEYEHDVNRFFRACPTMGVRSRNSLLSYARDILTWMRFIAARRGKSLWQVDRQDVIAFYRARRQRPLEPISASSWNRGIAALEKLYRWAAAEGLVDAPPFAYRQSYRRGQDAWRSAPVAVIGAYEPAARRGNMRFIDLENFLRFRDVGLRGHLPNGLEDPSWRGRNSERNALFAELLITTGLRVEEAGSLLVSELPPLDSPAHAGVKTIPFRIADAIAKGGRGREIRLPMRVLRRLWDYIAVERANALARRSPEAGDRNIHTVVGVADGKLAIRDEAGDAKQVRLDRLTPIERRRLRRLDAAGTSEPMIVWLTEGAAPVPTNSWEAVFRRAGERCQGFDIDVMATPHMLRHAFAVHMLSLLIREQIGSVFAHGRTAQYGSAYRRVIGDPLQKVQRLLGHSSITSTYIYLDSLEESRELVESAAAQLVAGLEPEMAP